MNDENGCFIKDLGSKNGTRVNDLPISTFRLRNRDTILLGSTEIVIHSDDDAETTSVVLSDDTPPPEQNSVSTRDTELLLSQQRLKLVYELTDRLLTLRNRDELLEDAMSICFETLHFERGAIAIRKRDKRGVEWPVVRNLRGAGGELKISRSVLGRALDHGERAIVNDTDATQFDPTVSMVQHGIRSAMCVPLIHGEEVLGVIYGDQVAQGRAYADEDVDFLAALAQQVTIGLVNANLMEEQRRMIVLQNEVNLAREIQQGLFPSSLPNREGLTFAVLNDPGRHVSGDYYDLIPLDDGRIGIVVADVTGEGVAASLIMANLQAVVRMTLPGVVDPAVLLHRWNGLMCDHTDSSKFVTCLLGILDPEAGTMNFANAGHLRPWIRGPQPGTTRELELDTGFPLGIVPDAEYQSAVITLDRPMMLFAYTDGVIEAMNSESDMFGEDRMTEVIAVSENLNPERLVQQMRKSLRQFSGDAAQSDDITMVAFELR
jgi:serine phosphatase RsbU (regulator of sigma subunit)